MRTTIYISLGILLLVITTAVGFFWGDKHALDSLTIVQVTPDQMVQAMGADNFYSLWRNSTILVSSNVASVIQQNGETLIQLKTGSVSRVYCDIGNTSTTLVTGDTIKVLAEGEMAIRMPEGVRLVNCQVL